MTYTTDYRSSAYRHLAAADALFTEPNRRVAGYLYGIAAECAIKAMMNMAGLRELPEAKRSNDAYYKHFPQLREVVLNRLKGRRGGPLLKFIENRAFLEHWHTNMRYCKGSEIQDSWISAWQTQARNAVAAIDT